MLEISNCYKLLRLDEDCSDLELRRQYRKCALESHPDRMRPIEDGTAVSPDKSFIKFNEAYRRIVNYRKKHRANAKNLLRDYFDENTSSGMDSFERLRERLGTLNCDMQENLAGKCGTTAGFAS